MLPAALIATTAIALGVEGTPTSRCCSLGLSPEVVIDTGLVTQVFPLDRECSSPVRTGRPQRAWHYSLASYLSRYRGIVGGQSGSAVARYIPQCKLMVGMGILFILVAGLVLGEVILNVR